MTGNTEGISAAGGQAEPPGAARAGFAVVLTCIDGRVQDPLAAWVRERYGVRYVDVVTEPGMDALLARGSQATLAAVLAKACVSRRAHGAATLVIAGHADCAGHPVPDAEHVQDVATAVHRTATALPEFEVAGAFVDAAGGVRAVEATG